jgi:hypothetical protein
VQTKLFTFDVVSITEYVRFIISEFIAIGVLVIGIRVFCSRRGSVVVKVINGYVYIIINAILIMQSVELIPGQRCCCSGVCFRVMS